jgi:hypothetical protein
MRALVWCTVLAAAAGAAFWACNPNSIGRPCVNPAGSDVRGTQISSPALECPSRLCLLQPAGGAAGSDDAGVRATCTAFCNNDGDCDPETKQYCQAGFVCAVAATAGNFCCRKMCVCKDDLQDNINRDPVDGGVILPAVCDPATYTGGQTPTCPNVKLGP